MIKARKRGMDAKGLNPEEKIKYRQSFAIDSNGMLVKPSKVEVISGQFDEDEPYTWVDEWDLDENQHVLVEVLLTNTRWGDTFTMIHIPPRLTIKHIAAVEELLSDFGLSLIGADPQQQTMAYVEAGIFSLEIVDE